MMSIFFLSFLIATTSSTSQDHKANDLSLNNITKKPYNLNDSFQQSDSQYQMQDISKEDLFQTLKLSLEENTSCSSLDLASYPLEDLLHLAQDLHALKALKSSILSTKQPIIDLNTIKPITRKNLPSSEEITSGKTALREGKVALFILGGGDGSRLGFTGPKGAFPLQQDPHLSLFKILLTQANKQCALYNTSLPIIILTSENNHTSTYNYLEEHNYFDYPKDSIYLLKQESIPFLSDKHLAVFQSPCKLAKGPNGNAGFLKALINAPFLETLQKQGVSYLHVIPVDNPLARPFDEELIGVCSYHHADMVLRCVERDDPQEKVGIIVEDKGIMKIIDYPDFPKEAFTQTLSSGKLLYPDGSINLFCMSIDWLKDIERSAKLSYHVARKIYPCYNSITQTLEKTSIIKAELFITDLLQHAKISYAIPTSKEDFFCPLKESKDVQSILTTLTTHERFLK